MDRSFRSPQLPALTDSSGQTNIGNLVGSWLPALDGVVDKLETGVRVADVGCGCGSSTILRRGLPGLDLARHRPARGAIQAARKAENLRSCDRWDPGQDPTLIPGRRDAPAAPPSTPAGRQFADQVVQRRAITDLIAPPTRPGLTR